MVPKLVWVPYQAKAKASPEPPGRACWTSSKGAPPLDTLGTGKTTTGRTRCSSVSSQGRPRKSRVGLRERRKAARCREAVLRGALQDRRRHSLLIVGHIVGVSSWGV